MAADTEPAYEDEAYGTAPDAPADAEPADGDPDRAAAGEADDAAERLSALVVYLARNLVDEPDGVEVDAERRGGGVFLTLRVPEAELGKVIGRQGRIARAMRTALSIAGARQHVRANLDIEG